MSFHKLCVIGKVAGEIKVRDLPSGGKVASFGLPINFTRPKKNETTGQWEGDSFFITVDVFNRERSQLADLVVQYLRKGSQVYVEGRLKNNEYTDKNNVKVSRPVLVADVVQFLDQRDGPMGMEGDMPASRPAARPAPARSGNGGGYSKPSGGYNGGGDFDDEPAPPPSPGRGGRSAPPEHSEDDIPF